MKLITPPEVNVREIQGVLIKSTTLIRKGFSKALLRNLRISGELVPLVRSGNHHWYAADEVTKYLDQKKRERAAEREKYLIPKGLFPQSWGNVE